MKKAAWCLWAYCVAGLLACEKAVSFDLDEAPPVLVVDAAIESGAAPTVVLTKSLSYFTQISAAVLAQSFVSGAQVSISDGTATHPLKEYKIPIGTGFFLSYYAPDTTQPGFLKGALNKTYTLLIVHEGKEYTATTTIPDTTRRIDSIWWRPVPNAVDDDEVTVFVRATDREGFGDYIRYFTRRNNGPFLPPANSVFDDFIIDGTTYELSVEPGFDRNRIDDDDNDGENDYYFRRGDTVSMKLANIDKATYDFWRTMEYSYGALGNPFSTPTRVTGNVSGGALGYFGGYATQYFQIIVPQ